MHRDLREFLHALEAAGELHRVRAEVDVELEVAEIADRACRMPANPSEGARAFDPAMAAAGGKGSACDRRARAGARQLRAAS